MGLLLVDCWGSELDWQWELQSATHLDLKKESYLDWLWELSLETHLDLKKDNYFGHEWDCYWGQSLWLDYWKGHYWDLLLVEMSPLVLLASYLVRWMEHHWGHHWGLYWESDLEILRVSHLDASWGCHWEERWDPKKGIDWVPDYHLGFGWVVHWVEDWQWGFHWEKYLEHHLE